MSKNLEEAYRNEIMSDLPDLWSRIEASLPDMEVNNSSKTDESESTEELDTIKEFKKNEKKVSNKKPFRIPTWVKVAVPMAAIGLMVVVPLTMALGGGALFIASNSSPKTIASTTACDAVDEASGTYTMAYIDTVEEASTEAEVEESYEEYSESASNGASVEESVNNKKDETVTITDGSSSVIPMDKSNTEIDYSQITTQIVAYQIEVVINNIYEDEQGINAEVSVVTPAVLYLDTPNKGLIEFEENENIKVHIFGDREDLVIGENYIGNIFLANDTANNEWWEFVVKDK